MGSDRILTSNNPTRKKLRINIGTCVTRRPWASDRARERKPRVERAAEYKEQKRTKIKVNIFPCLTPGPWGWAGRGTTGKKATWKRQIFGERRWRNGPVTPQGSADSLLHCRLDTRTLPEALDGSNWERLSISPGSRVYYDCSLDGGSILLRPTDWVICVTVALVP